MRRERLLRRFESPRTPLVVALVGFLLALPSVATRYFLDDRYHEYYLRGGSIPGSMRGSWDLYRFADGSPELARAVSEGVYPWWTKPSLKIAFFRPLPSLWRWADFHAFGASAIVPHLETCLVYAALVFVVAKLYGRWIGGGAAGVAALAFAVDHGHALPITWISNRYALLAALFAFGSLLAHVRAQADERASVVARAASPALFALALLSGETALGALGYYAGHAWFVDPRGRRSAFSSLLPHGAVLLAWAATYRALGYGVAGSSLYIDPLHSPRVYLTKLLVRLPELLLSGVSLPPAQAWAFVPPERVALVAAGAASLVVLILTAAVRLAIRGDRTMRGPAFALLSGMVFAALPVCAMMPDDRNFLVPGFGCFGVLGLAIAAAWKRASEARLGERALVWVLVGIHLVLAPLALPLEGLNTAAMFGRYVGRGVRSLPSPERTAGKTLVVVGMPDSLIFVYMLVERMLEPGPQIHSATVLTVQGVGRYTMRCVDPDTVEIENPRGELASPFAPMYTDVPFYTGQVFDRAIDRVEVTEVTARGEPSGVRATIRVPPADRVWLVWKDGGFVELPAPRPGDESTFAAVDLFTELQKRD